VAGSGGRRQEPSHLVVGHVTKAHGTKGEVFVWPLTDRPDEILAEGQSVWPGDTEGQLLETAEPLAIRTVRPFKRGFLVRFEGATDRTTAEPLAGRYLLVERDRLSEPEADEWYYHELLGMQVVTEAGDAVGVVREVFEAAPADLLDVEMGEGSRRLVPMSKQIIRAVDRESRTIRIDPPAGLLEL
jgi:16S rRNA processing protein RimM